MTRFLISRQDPPSRKTFKTCVIILSLPHPWIPRIAFSCALQTALGRIITRSHTTTKPSASPVTRRALERMNVAAWTCEAWPRRMFLGDGAESFICEDVGGEGSFWGGFGRILCCAIGHLVWLDLHHLNVRCLDQNKRWPKFLLEPQLRGFYGHVCLVSFTAL